VKTYVMMTKFAAQDAHLVEFGSRVLDRVRNGDAWLEQIIEECPEVTFRSHYALLGYWDFMDIYEAPDEETAAKVSLLSRAHGAHQVESWPAIPKGRLKELTQGIL